MRMALALAALAITCVPAAAQRWMHLTLQSPPGEWIGDGQNWDVMYTDENTVPGLFAVELETWDSGPGPNFLRLAAMQEPVSTNLISADFSTHRIGEAIAPGLFLNAQRASFAEPGHPGLDVSFQHRGSNTLTGQFEVQAIAYHSSGSAWVVDYFSASFVQHSEGGPLALTGTIEYSAVPEPTALLTIGMGMAALARRRIRRPISLTSDSD